MRRTLKLLIGVFICCLAVPVLGATVRVEVTGSVTFVDPALSSAFPTGTAMSGFFEYVPPGTDGSFDSNFGVYNDALTAFSLTIGSYTATATGGEIQVSNAGFGDELQFNTNLAAGLSGATVNGLSLIRSHFFFFDPGATALSGDTLPTPAEIMAFSIPQANSFASLVFDGAQVSALYGAAVSFVPIPGPLALLAIPCGFLATCRTRMRLREA